MHKYILNRNDQHLFPIQCYIAQEDLLNAASTMLLEGLASQECLTRPKDTAEFLQLALAREKTEHFAVIFLNNQHRLIAYELLFQGTINGATIHPRVVVQKALAHNAAAVVLAHNHPSGCCEPSQADRVITHKLADALRLVDIRVLDHLIVTPTEWISLAEIGDL
jgi:DNA repair protein RadC